MRTDSSCSCSGTSCIVIEVEIAPDLPELVPFPLIKKFVERIIDISLRGIRKSTCDHEEENDTHRKNINIFPAVGPSLENFRSLILSGTDLGVVNPEAVVSFFAGT